MYIENVCVTVCAADVRLFMCAAHKAGNIISRSVIAHVDVMTLGLCVDYTVGKQQPADWVSELPYITSPHSSLCFSFYRPRVFFFQNHHPQFPA